MKFDICERVDGEYAMINLEKNCLKNIKVNLANIKAFEIDENVLNLSLCLYGDTKQKSIEIQKQNCKQMLKLYAVCVKLVKLLKRKKIKFNGVFYTKNLADKKNNNDFMLKAMLEVRFNVKPFKKLSASYTYCADYLDMENSLNKMCDFRDNKCSKYRTIKSDRTTGCCSKVICKYTCNAPCPTWNLACKIIMCDYLIEKKGYYFTPHTIPIMKRQFSFFERCFSVGQLCRTKKKALSEIWLLRIGGLLMTILGLGIVALLCI